MKPRHGNRARLGALLAAALGTVALLALPSVAAAKDRNRDHIPDRWEKRHHLSLHVNQDRRDQDRDHLGNRGEFKAGDNPRDRDTDNDGVMDGEENAGTIASFDQETGKLTINLFGGETVTGFVTEDTRIECGHGCKHHAEDGDDQASASDDGNSGPGDGHSGPGDGSEPPSAGQGGQENDDPAGDDNGMPGANQGPGNEDEQGDNGASCTTAALVVGATVEEAELEVSNGKATFEKIVLQQEDQSEQGEQP
jgi:hypothetical protein